MAVLVEKGSPEELPYGAGGTVRRNDDGNAMLETACQDPSVPW